MEISVNEIQIIPELRASHYKNWILSKIITAMKCGLLLVRIICL